MKLFLFTTLTAFVLFSGSYYLAEKIIIQSLDNPSQIKTLEDKNKALLEAAKKDKEVIEYYQSVLSQKKCLDIWVPLGRKEK